MWGQMAKYAIYLSFNSIAKSQKDDRIYERRRNKSYEKSNYF